MAVNQSMPDGGADAASVTDGADEPPGEGHTIHGTMHFLQTSL